jgi:hypothetical protein
MAASRPSQGPIVKEQCRRLVKHGTSIANICLRLGVSKSYAKRVRAEVEAERKASDDDAD